jgi:hypothetical protein
MERISEKNSPFKSEHTKSFDEKLKNSGDTSKVSDENQKSQSSVHQEQAVINLRRVESNEKADLDGRVTSLNKIQTPKNQLDYNAGQPYPVIASSKKEILEEEKIVESKVATKKSLNALKSEQTLKVGSRTERGISEFKSHKSLDPDIECQSNLR